MRIRSIRPLMPALLVLSLTAPSSAAPRRVAVTGSLAAELAQLLPGAWHMEAIQADGRARPIGTRTFTQIFASGVILAWEERNVSGALHSRGFLGARDSTAAMLFYLAVAPNAPPIAITGHADIQTRSIDWSLTPAVGADHPYNRELVASRLHLLGPTAFDWIAPGHWHIRFRKAG